MMAEHEGELANEQEDPFADLEPPLRRSERTTQILALAMFIASAKNRGNSWANICRRLEERKGITVSPDHLRMTMERYAGYTPKARRRAKPNRRHAAKKNTKTAEDPSASAGAGTEGEQENENAALAGGQIPNAGAEGEHVTANPAAAASEQAEQPGEQERSVPGASESRPQSAPDLRHAAYRRAGQKP